MGEKNWSLLLGSSLRLSASQALLSCRLAWKVRSPSRSVTRLVSSATASLIVWADTSTLPIASCWPLTIHVSLTLATSSRSIFAANNPSLAKYRKGEGVLRKQDGEKVSES